MLQNHDYALDFRQLREELSDFYQRKGGRRGRLYQDTLKNLLQEMVENGRLQQDGETWTLPGRPTH